MDGWYMQPGSATLLQVSIEIIRRYLWQGFPRFCSNLGVPGSFPFQNTC
jgi:hypothetical protein